MLNLLTLLLLFTCPRELTTGLTVPDLTQLLHPLQNVVEMTMQNQEVKPPAEIR